MRAKADAPAASRLSQELAAGLAVGAATASAVGETRCINRSQDSFSTLAAVGQYSEQRRTRGVPESSGDTFAVNRNPL
jgi:hypothetical protein